MRGCPDLCTGRPHKYLYRHTRKDAALGNPPLQPRPKKGNNNALLLEVVTMSRGPFLFKETTVRRAIQAANAAGLAVTRVVISPTGDVSLVTVPAVPGERAERVAVEVVPAE